MNYKFPIIHHINDVLPHVEGRDEFVVAERDFGTVINYVVAKQDTFDMTDSNDVGGAIRRECRGLIFDKDGNIMSRPFHKFFNVNERDETQSHAVDMTQEHIVMEKMDGSMIRPLLVDGYLRLGTKMGVTTVSMQAEEWLAAHPNSEELKGWLRGWMIAGVTPLFEWISPDNQIVLEYPEPDLVLLAVRDTHTGEYLDIHGNDHIPFTKVKEYSSVDGSLGDYIAKQRQAEGREGDIIRFADGHHLKIKNDWYVRIHKAMDRVRFDRNIVNLIVHEEIDDVVPMMPEKEIARIREFEDRFWAAFRAKHAALAILSAAAKELPDRKTVATEFIPTIEPKTIVPMIYKVLDGHEPRDILLDQVTRNIGSNARWDAFAEWFMS